MLLCLIFFCLVSLVLSGSVWSCMVLSGLCPCMVSFWSPPGPIWSLWSYMVLSGFSGAIWSLWSGMVASGFSDPIWSLSGLPWSYLVLSGLSSPIWSCLVSLLLSGLSGSVLVLYGPVRSLLSFQGSLVPSYVVSLVSLVWHTACSFSPEPEAGCFVLMCPSDLLSVPTLLTPMFSGTMLSVELTRSP